MAVGYFAHVRPEMQRYVRGDVTRLLDIGCGEGMFAASIKARQPVEVTGIELNPKAAASAATRLDRVIVGDALAGVDSLARGTFDCIVFNDVLEHMIDPDIMLARARPLVAPGGRVVASIPNVRYYRVVLDLALRGRWDYADHGVLDRTHLRFFTRRSLTALFNDSGYHIESLVGINPPRLRLLRLARPLLRAIDDALFEEMFCMQFAIVAVPRR